MGTSSTSLYGAAPRLSVALFATLWCTGWHSALAAPPETRLSDDEKSRLLAGEVVVRASVGESGAESTGLAWVHASPDKIWEEVFDFGARVPESPNLEGAAEYGRTGRHDWGVLLTVSVLGLGGELNLRLHWDEPGRWATFTLDPDRESLLAVAQGYYRVDPLNDGYLLTYYALSKTKIYVPGFIQRTVAERDMAEIMGYLRARSEGTKE